MKTNRIDTSQRFREVRNLSSHAINASTIGAPALLPLLVMLTLLSNPIHAQVPSVLWTTNLGARLFAVDSQTNVYANAGGTVIILSGAGVPLQTNSICPRPGLAHRDSDGNYYFAGVLPSHVNVTNGNTHRFDPQDFGGVVLSNLPVFLVKYSPAGNLLWATNFGLVNEVLYPAGINVMDLVQDANGNMLVAYTYNTTTTAYVPVATKFGPDGSQAWSVILPRLPSPFVTQGVRLTSATPASGFAITYGGPDVNGALLSQFDANGNVATVTNWPSPFFNQKNAPRAIVNSLGELYNAEGMPNLGIQLTKRQASGSVIWRLYTGNIAQWVVGRDQFDGVHVAVDPDQLSRYDSDGNLAWTINLPAACEEVILDSQGNRFLALVDGTMARLGAELLVVPLITDPPQGQTILSGSNAVFFVGASGTTPMRYYWRFMGTNIPSATNSTLTLANVAPSQAGDYQVVVSNHVGSVTSAPALLRIKSVAIYADDQLLTHGTHVYSNPPTISIRSAFVNGSAFYTLDGSTPSFASTPYFAPFTLASNATIRALGYIADFSQSEEADIVNLIVLPRHTLSVSTSGGGSVGLYSSNCIPPPAGLVASWRGEGNALDHVGTNHGTVQGNLSYAAGVVNRAFTFYDGSGGVTVAPSPTLDVGLGNGFTIEFWFNWTPSTWAPLVQWTSKSNSPPVDYGYCGIVLYPNPEHTKGNLSAGFTVGSSLYSFGTADGIITNNAVHHAALTYEKTTGIGTIYLDGQVVAQQNLGSFTPRTSDFLYIGKTQFGTYYPSGLMDEVSIYNRALPLSEIQSIYLAGSSGKCVPISAAGSHLATEVLTPTAVPSAGYSFFYWLGDAMGTSPTVSISMERDKAIHAVFGTTLSTIVAGGGQIQLSPPGGLYPAGTTVRLTAVPQPGNYFGLWGNAASGNTNPLNFKISAPTQTVSSIFGALPAGQAALTVLINGRGQVNVNPRANLYSTNQTVTLTALPDTGQSFLNWTGDASGAQNPLMVSMAQSRAITANFTTSRPLLRVDRPGFEGPTPDGFRLTLVGDPSAVYQILGSTNLTAWQGLGSVTNIFGEVQFTDTNAPGFRSRFYKAAP